MMNEAIFLRAACSTALNRSHDKAISVSYEFVFVPFIISKLDYTTDTETRKYLLLLLFTSLSEPQSLIYAFCYYHLCI